MYCVIQEVPVKKVSCGEAKEILVDKTTITMDGVTKTKYYYTKGGGHYDRPHKKAYRISIHKSFRKEGKVCKQQVAICTIDYYDIIDWGGWYRDYIIGTTLQKKLEQLGITEDELTEMICGKFDPIVEKIQAEFAQSEEGIAKVEHEKILKEYNDQKVSFAKKYNINESEYDYCYDVFGTLRNPEYLRQIQRHYEFEKEYEQRSSSYYENYQSNYNDYFKSSYGASGSSNYNDDDRARLKSFYRTLSKAYHPDSNPDRDTSAEMKLLNQLKNEWGI